MEPTLDEASLALHISAFERIILLERNSRRLRCSHREISVIIKYILLPYGSMYLYPKVLIIR